MATIIDVAREADVSVATVSRVINNSFVVTDEKKNRVFSAMEKVGYIPTIKPKKNENFPSKLILVITNIYYEELFDTLQNTAESLEYDVLFCHLSQYADSTSRAIRIMTVLKEHVFAGIVVCNALHNDPQLTEIIKSYPVVQIGEYLDLGENYLISIDDFQSAYDTVNHLIETGKKRIAIMTINPSLVHMSFAKTREHAYMSALIDNNLPIDAALRFTADFTYDGGADTTIQILKHAPRPDAIFCVSDMMAIGCIRTLNTCGIQIPQEISVSGFDDMDVCNYLYPSLTSVRQPYSEMGFEAIRLLHSIINKDITSGRKVMLKHELIIRESTQLHTKS